MDGLHRTRAKWASYFHIETRTTNLHKLHFIGSERFTSSSNKTNAKQTQSTTAM